MSARRSILLAAGCLLMSLLLSWELSQLTEFVRQNIQLHTEYQAQRLFYVVFSLLFGGSALVLFVYGIILHHIQHED